MSLRPNTFHQHREMVSWSSNLSQRRARALMKQKRQEKLPRFLCSGGRGGGDRQRETSHHTTARAVRIDHQRVWRLGHTVRSWNWQY